MIVDVLSARNQRLSHCSNFTRIKCVSARNQRESFGNSLKEWPTVMYDVSCYQIASFARFLFLAKKKVFSFFSALQLQCTSCIEKIPALKKIIFFNVNASWYWYYYIPINSKQLHKDFIWWYRKIEIVQMYYLISLNYCSFHTARNDCSTFSKAVSIFRVLVQPRKPKFSSAVVTSCKRIEQNGTH